MAAAQHFFLALFIHQVFSSEPVVEDSLLSIKCHGHTILTPKLRQVERVCLETAPPSAEDACLHLCLLTNLNITVNGTLSPEGTENILNEIHSNRLRNSIRLALRKCNSGPHYGIGDGVSCEMAEKFLKCIKTAAEEDCQQSKPNGKLFFKYSKTIELKRGGG